ncbi:MAG: hypothetical protein AAB681_01865 [Patescibacteria group bacterium]
MERKQFFVTFWNRKDPKHQFVENGVHGATDQELVDWFLDPNRKIILPKISDIEIQEQPESGKRILRLDLSLKIIKPIVFTVGQIVKPTFFMPLPEREVAPPLTPTQEVAIKEITLDRLGHQHLDVGLLSRYSSIRSYETGEDLPNCEKIHWCHPGRFELVA